jgi:hypothetical protein
MVSFTDIIQFVEPERAMPGITQEELKRTLCQILDVLTQAICQEVP